MHWLRRAALSSIGAVAGPKICRGNIVLCLHSIRADQPRGIFAPNRDLSITPGFLVEVVEALRDAGSRIVPLDELYDRVKSGCRGRYSAITFDDGYRDNAELAFPVLERLAAPFTVFFTPGFLDRTLPMWWVLLERLIGERDVLATRAGALPTKSLVDKNRAFAILSRNFRSAEPRQISRLADELINQNSIRSMKAEIMASAMEWEAARMLYRSGLMTVGCHTMTHPTLSNLSRDDIEVEIIQAREQLTREIGVTPTHFAYPFGSSAEIEPLAPHIVRQAGFTAAWTTRRNLLTMADLADPFRLPRVTLDGRYQSRRVLQAYLSGAPFALRDGFRLSTVATVSS